MYNQVGRWLDRYFGFVVGFGSFLQVHALT